MVETVINKYDNYMLCIDIEIPEKEQNERGKVGGVGV